jgi:hypothetical protein
MFQSDRQECKNAPWQHGRLVDQIADRTEMMPEGASAIGRGRRGVRYPRSPHTKTLIAAVPRIARQ